jgi:hypothetical protein
MCAFLVNVPDVLHFALVYQVRSVRAARTAARVCDTFATPSSANACALVVFDMMANGQ